MGDGEELEHEPTPLRKVRRRGGPCDGDARARRLVGFSRLTGADEEGTLARQKAIRGELIDPRVRKHHGRVVKSTGDGIPPDVVIVLDPAFLI